MHLKLLTDVRGRGAVLQEPNFTLAMGYRSWRLLLTTVKLERAMAAEASIGESRPRAATGMPNVL